MLNHNLIDLFKSFSNDEIKKFERFLKSPYFNNSEKMLKLFSEIVAYYPEFDHKDFNKKIIATRSTQSGRYNDSTFRDALSELLKLALRFLSISNFEKNEFEVENFLLDDLLHRKSDKLIRNRVRKNLITDSTIDARNLYNKYWHNTLLFNFAHKQKNILHSKDAIDRLNQIKSISFDLLNFYISEIISLYLNSRIFAEKYNITSSFNPINTLIKNLDLDNLLKVYKSEHGSIIITLYKFLIQTFNFLEKEDYYFRYKEFFEKNVKSFSPDEIAFHYNWMINYCILRKRSANTPKSINYELFRLYTVLLNNKYYKDRKNKYLSDDLYRDIMIHGLFLKEYDWTLNFINKHIKDVNPTNKENLLNFSYTYFYSHTGNYPKALHHYNKIIMNNFVYKYDIKNIVIKMYYELNYYEEAICEIKSFKEFLRNNTLVSEHRKIRIGNYLKYFEKFIILKIENNKNEIEYLRRRIESENQISYKDWLLSKVTSCLGK